MIRILGQRKAARACIMILAPVALHTSLATAKVLGQPETVPVTATVDNDITIITSNNDLGAFSVVGHTTDTATGTVLPGGGYTDDPGTGAGLGSAEPASFVWSGGDPPQSPTIALSAGFFGALFRVTYDNVVDLACAGGSTLRIMQITDDLPTPGIWDNTGGGGPTITSGKGTLDAGGAATFHVGMSLETTPGDTYSSGGCTGSFEFVIEYG